MATQSDSSPNPADNQQQNPVSLQQTPEEHQSSKPEAATEKSPPSVFVNSEPIREEQVKNAVMFLSHPKVRGSPVMHRRSFLERKGLTKEEIDEAFRRVPDPTPTVSSTQATVATQGEQVKTSSNVQPQTQSTQLAPAAPVGSVGYFHRLHWSHVVFAVGFLAASGTGTAILVKKSLIPRLKSWIRRVVQEDEAEDEGDVKGKSLKPSVAEEAAQAAKAAAAAASDVARASMEMMASKSEEKKYFKELTDLLNYQVLEMKSMTSAIQKLEGSNNVSGRPQFSETENRKISVSSSQQFYANGKVDTDTSSVRSLSPPKSVEPSGPPHPKSYMEILEMVQRGERPPNVRDINDQPPNPNQPVPEPQLAPKPKPWEVSQTRTSSSNFIQDNNNNNNNLLNGGNSTPWWQPHKNTRITEIESGDEQKFASSGIQTIERPAPPQRSWVPPQPPPVAMAEAAAAIRQPKRSSSLQSDQLTDDQLLGRASSPEISDDLQRITKISETGGVTEANGVTSGDDSTVPQQTPLAEGVANLE